jgi:hypothetical protein
VIRRDAQAAQPVAAARPVEAVANVPGTSVAGAAELEEGRQLAGLSEAVLPDEVRLLTQVLDQLVAGDGGFGGEAALEAFEGQALVG